jgi:type I restriction enzyme S subunit
VGVSAFVDQTPPRIIVSGKMVGLRPNTEVVIPPFLALALNDARTQEYLDQRTTGMAESQVNFENSALLSAPLWLPPLGEQEAIAGALSDADAAIGALDVLIAKKRAVRQAAMQQLLSGRTRLPGLEGVWSEVHLGEIGACIRGVSYDPRTDLRDGDGESTVRLLRSNNVQQSLLTLDDVQFVMGTRVSSEQVLRVGDVVICMANGSRALVGKSALFDGVVPETYTFGAFMGCYRTNRSLAHPEFVRYLFLTKSYQDGINNLLSGSAINNLAPSSIESLKFAIPTYEEQVTIAEVLSEMDAEVKALVAEQDKLRLVKQGMMQDLLSGSVRLS